MVRQMAAFFAAGAEIIGSGDFSRSVAKENVVSEVHTGRCISISSINTLMLAHSS